MKSTNLVISRRNKNNDQIVELNLSAIANDIIPIFTDTESEYIDFDFNNDNASINISLQDIYKENKDSLIFLEKMLKNENDISDATFNYENDVYNIITISLKEKYIDFQIDMPFFIYLKLELSKTAIIALIKCILEKFRIENNLRKV